MVVGLSRLLALASNIWQTSHAARIICWVLGSTDDVAAVGDDMDGAPSINDEEEEDRETARLDAVACNRVWI